MTLNYVAQNVLGLPRELLRGPARHARRLRRDRLLPRPALVADPYPYFEHLRAQCPVQREPHHDVVMVTGLRRSDRGLPRHRDVLVVQLGDRTVPRVPGPARGRRRQRRSSSSTATSCRSATSSRPSTRPMHTDHRALLMRLITPKRLKENEEFMWRLADRQIDEFLADGRVRVHQRVRQPVRACSSSPTCSACPRRTTTTFRERARPATATGASAAPSDEAMAHNPLEFLYERFTDYIEDRRREPRDDVLTGLATATFPDGSTPEVIDVVRIAANLFAAGQETTVRLLGAALQLHRRAPRAPAAAARRARPHPELRRGDAAVREPGQGRLPPVAGPDDGRRRRHPRRHHRDGAQRRRQPRPAPVRATRRVRRRPRRTPASTSRSATASTRCPGAPLAAGRGPRQPRAPPRPHGRHPDLRGGARPGRRPPLRVRADLHPARPAPRLHLEFTPVDAPARR